MARQAKKVSAIEEVKAAIIRHQWGMSGAEKVTRYVGKFFDRQRIGKKIVSQGSRQSRDVYGITLCESRAGGRRLQLLCRS